MRTGVILLWVFVTACTALYCGEAGIYGSEYISLLKEEDLLTGNHQDPGASITEPEPEKWYVPSIFGARFGILYPGTSRETGNFLTGPVIGAYAHFPLGPGVLELTLDLSSHKCPGEISRDYTLLISGGANYLYNFTDTWFAGGGMSLANVTGFNDMILLQAAGGIHLFGKADIALTIYHPPGHDNNTLLTGLYFGYRF